MTMWKQKLLDVILRARRYFARMTVKGLRVRYTAHDSLHCPKSAKTSTESPQQILNLSLFCLYLVNVFQPLLEKKKNSRPVCHTALAQKTRKSATAQP